MSIEHVRTAEEILREAATVVYGNGSFRERAAPTATPIENRLALEVAAGDLAQALLRRRVRELERALSTSRADRMPAR